MICHLHLCVSSQHEQARIQWWRQNDADDRHFGCLNHDDDDDANEWNNQTQWKQVGDQVINGNPFFHVIEIHRIGHFRKNCFCMRVIAGM